MRTISFLVLGLFILNGCTAGSGSSTTGASAIEKIPKVTGAVSGSGGIRTTRSSRSEKLGTFSGLTWDNTKSQAMCFTGDGLRNLLSEAAGPDLLLCKLGVLEKNGLLEFTYDGAAQYFTAVGLVSAGETERFKFDATKSGDSIETFHLYSCKSASVQDSYVTATITSGFVSMQSMSHYTAGSASGRQFATTSGMIDSDGAWTSKMIAYQGITSDTNWSRSAQLSITQTSSKATFYGSFWGAVNSVNEAGCFTSVSEIVDSSSLATFALGDGVMKHTLNVGALTCGSTSATIAWDGDARTNLPLASSSTYFSEVSLATVPTLASFTESNVTFSGDRIWDCSVAEDVPSVDVADFSEAVSTELAACDTEFSLSRTGADCQSADAD